MSAPTRRLTVAQALVRFLSVQYTERDGVRRRLIAGTWGIFGHGNVAGIGQALLEAGIGPDAAMPYHQGRNEQAMVHAAVGHARQLNRLSAQAVTTSIGPGATNLVTGAALATVNRLPVLLLPGDYFATRAADPLPQRLEHPTEADVSVNDTLRPVSRYFDRVTRPEALIPSALNAVRVLADPAGTGAVTLALPQDVQAEAYDWPEEFFAERVWHVRRPAPDPAELAAAVDAIRAARRPLIVAGGGVHHSEAEEALKALADATGIPVASTQAGKGSLRHDHPADLGGIGHTGTAVCDDIARTADLVIGVGTRYTDFTTASGTLFRNPDVRFVNLNIAAFDAHKLAARTVVCDARAGLERLAEALAGHRVDAGHEAGHRAGKERWERVVEAAHRAADDSAVEAAGQGPATEVLRHEHQPASAEVAAALGVAEGEEVVVLERLRSTHGHPVASLCNHLPASLLELGTAQPESTGLYRLMRTAGITLHSARQTVGARCATDEEAARLGEKEGAALLTMQRTAYDDTGRPVEYGTHIYRASRYAFDFQLLVRP